MPEPWWKSTFGKPYLRYYRDLLGANDVSDQIRFFIKHAQTNEQHSILDLACGHGRHLVELARLGYTDLTGLDQSRHYLGIARRNLKRIHAQALFLHADYHQLDLDEVFDHVTCFYTSFGYSRSSAADKDVLLRVHRALRPGGFFLLDLNNPTKTIKLIKSQARCRRGRWIADNIERLSDGLVVHKHYSYRPAQRVWHIRRRWKERGKSIQYYAAIRLYSRSAVMKMLKSVGFENVRLFGGFDSTPLSPDSDRMIFIAKRGHKAVHPPMPYTNQRPSTFPKTSRSTRRMR
jgi:SAM-dependent methyltransferase